MSNIRTVRDFDSGAGPGGRPSSGNYRQQMNAPPLDNGINERGISMVAVPPDPANPIPTLTERFFPHANRRTATAILAIFLTVMFIIELIVGGAKFHGAFVKGNSMAGPGPDTMLYMGGKFGPALRDNYELHRLFTPIALHAGILHLLANLFFQLRFGFVLELRWGIPKFLAIYLLTGIGASLWSTELSYCTISVGASGALFGLLGADFSYVLLNWAEIPQRGAEMFMLVFVVIINFLIGMGPNVDNYAHLGGLITGVFAGAAICDSLVARPNEKQIRGLAGGLMGGLFLLFILLIWVGKPDGVGVCF